MQRKFIVLSLCLPVSLLTGCSGAPEPANKDRSAATVAENVEAVYQAQTTQERDDAVVRLAHKLAATSKDQIAISDRAKVLTVLRKVLVESTSTAARAKASEGLGIVKDVDSVPALIHAMLDDSEEVRVSAGKAITRILGIEFGYRADASEAERRKIAQKYHDYYDAHVVGSNLEAVLRGERDMKDFEDAAHRRSAALRDKWPTD